MVDVRALPYLFSGALLAFLSACGKPQQAASDAEGSAPPAAVAQTSGQVNLAPDAPELRQMTIEEVRAIPIPSDAVTAPAKIEANPNRIGRALLPIPGKRDSDWSYAPIPIIGPLVGAALAGLVAAWAAF